MSINSVFLSSGERDLKVVFKLHPRNQAWSRVEAKNSAFLSSCDGYLLEPIEWPKGSQASYGVLREDSGLLFRPCRKRKASCRDDGGISCFFFFELWPDVWGFSRGTTGNSGILSCVPREVQSPFEVRRGAGDCTRVTAGQIDLIWGCVQKLRVPLQW